MDTSKNVGIYEVAAIERPTVAALEQGKVARLILAPTAVIANGRSSAIVAASRLIDPATTFDDQRTDWIVRRFVGDNAC